MHTWYYMWNISLYHYKEKNLQEPFVLRVYTIMYIIYHDLLRRSPSFEDRGLMGFHSCRSGSSFLETGVGFNLLRNRKPNNKWGVIWFSSRGCLLHLTAFNSHSNMEHLANVVLMLGQRRRRWPSIKTILEQCLMEPMLLYKTKR